MKLKAAREAYYLYSGKTSDISRQLSFAGLAIIWLFTKSEGSEFVIPDELLLPMFFLVLSLTCDFLQYISATLVWGIFQRYHERKFERQGITDISEKEITASEFQNWPALGFFSLKVLFLLTGYIFLLIYFKNFL